MGARTGVALVALLPALLPASGCFDSRAEDGWPCNESRPCAAGWVCAADGLCHPGTGPSYYPHDVGGSTPDDGRPGPIDLGSGAPEIECKPACPPGACGPDGCGGSCGVCPLPVQSGFVVPGTEPRGVAVAPNGVWLGDNSDRVIRLLDPADGAVLATANLPAEGLIVDLAYDEVTGKVVCLLRDPAGLWVLEPEVPPVALSADIEATAVSFDSVHLLTIEGANLVRRDRSTLAVVQQTALEEVDATCVLLGAQAGAAFRWCGVQGQPGSYVHDMFRFDAVSPTAASALEPLRVTLDASEVHGVAAEAKSLWLLGRGYGADAGRIVRVEVP